MMFTEEEIKKLRAGQVVDINGKRYKMCPVCKTVVRIDGFFGSLHLCN